MFNQLRTKSAPLECSSVQNQLENKCIYRRASPSWQHSRISGTVTTLYILTPHQYTANSGGRRPLNANDNIAGRPPNRNLQESRAAQRRGQEGASSSRWRCCALTSSLDIVHKSAASFAAPIYKGKRTTGGGRPSPSPFNWPRPSRGSRVQATSRS